MTEQEIPNETYFNRHKNVRGSLKATVLMDGDWKTSWKEDPKAP